MGNELLKISHLKKAFGETEVLKDISFDINKGEVVVILGPSGCGKSTLLRCINGLEEFQDGEISLDGQSLSDGKVPWHLIRQKIGMVFQSYDLFPHMTILDNILLGPTKAQKRDSKEVKEMAASGESDWKRRRMPTRDSCPADRSRESPSSDLSV